MPQGCSKPDNTVVWRICGGLAGVEAIALGTTGLLEVAGGEQPAIAQVAKLPTPTIAQRQPPTIAVMRFVVMTPLLTQQCSRASRLPAPDLSQIRRDRGGSAIASTIR